MPIDPNTIRWDSAPPQSRAPAQAPVAQRAPQAPPLRQVVPAQPRLPPVRAPEQVQGDMLSNELAALKIETARAEEEERQEAAQQREAGIRDTVFSMQGVIDAAKKARDLSRTGLFATGFGASAAREWGGTTAADVAALLKTIGANTAFDRLQKMRDESKTGGALGQVSEIELQLLRDSIASIDQSQSDEQFQANMDRVVESYQRVIDRLEGKTTEPRGMPDEGGATTRGAERGDAVDVAPEGQVLLGYGKNEDGSPYPLYGYPASPDGGGGAPPPASTPTGGGGPGIGSYLRDATQSTLAGVAQGAAGLIDLPLEVGNAAERGVNYAVGRGGGALMDLAGLGEAADWWRRGSDRVEANLTNRTGAADAIEQLSPTPEGMGAGRLVSQFLGGAMVPIGPKAVPRVKPSSSTAPLSRDAAREVIDAGKQAGVRVMTSDVRPPRTFVGRNARALGERIPFAGTGGPRQAQQAERVEAVRDLARDFGADVATDYLAQVADDLGKTRGARLTALSGQKNGVIDGIAVPLAPENVARTQQAIDAQVRRLAGIDATEYAPVIARLQRFGENIASGKTLRQVEENRKLLGAMFEDASLASIKTEGQKALNAIYNPLRDDMGAFIRANAGDGAYMKWAKANEELASMAGELGDNVFRGVLNSAETTPENVAKLLFSKKPSEVRRLVGNLSPEGRARAQAAVIARAVETGGGLENISPDRFANAVRDLGKQIGVMFEGADLARIKGLERLLQQTKQASVASAHPPTGAQNSLAIIAAVLTDMLGSAGAAITTGGAIGAGARLYESAAMRNLLAGLGMSKPGTTNESQLIERILKVATSQMQIRGGAANDAMGLSPSRAVAEDQENN